MFVWITPLIVIVVLAAILSLVRLTIPRDPRKEGANDDESTRAYDQVSRGLVFEVLRLLALTKLKRYQPQGILVDAGCGPGNLALVIAKEYPQLKITGIDVSDQMIELAEKKLSRGNFNHRVTFRTADVSDLPFENNTIDFVISTLSLHHWVKPENAFQEIYRVLKPGGNLLIFDLRRDEPLLVYYTGYVVQRLFTPYHIRRVNGAIGSIWSSYTPVELRSLISKSPFLQRSVQAGWAWAYIWASKSTNVE
jgi:ubiquinone/menaquinone biosynthesis C-methylase UbiE